MAESGPAAIPGKWAAGSADAQTLADALKRAIRGEVSFDAGAQALYATDASNYRHVPIGLVTPRTTDDLIATISICREQGAPIFARGAGTSIGGQTCNAAVVLDLSRHLNQIIELDPEK